MGASMNLHRRWEVRPTLRLVERVERGPADVTLAVCKRVEGVVRANSSISFANVSVVVLSYSEAIMATLVLAQPSTPGEAVDEATRLLAEACAIVGLAVDAIVEVVVEMAGIDPRSL